MLMFYIVNSMLVIISYIMIFKLLLDALFVVHCLRCFRIDLSVTRAPFIINMQHYGDHARTNINILEWITRPRSFSKGQNLPYHIKAVKRFLNNIKAPEEYHQAILINSLDEDCQLEVFAHPEYQEENNSFQDTCDLLLKVFDTRRSGFSKLVRLLEIQQETHESLSQYLARLRVESYKMFGDEDKEQNEKFITSAFLNGLKNKSVSKAIQTLELRPQN